MLVEICRFVTGIGVRIVTDIWHPLRIRVYCRILLFVFILSLKCLSLKCQLYALPILAWIWYLPRSRLEIWIGLSCDD